MNNLGFTGSYDPRQNANQFYGGYDPAGTQGAPQMAAPHSGDMSSFGGESDPMSFMAEGTYAPAGPKFAQAPKKKAKWRGKAKAGLEGFAAATASAPPIQHHRFGSMNGLLGG